MNKAVGIYKLVTMHVKKSNAFRNYDAFGFIVSTPLHREILAKPV